MKEKLNACFTRLQQLDLQPTRKNMENLLQTLYDLRDVYNELEKLELEGGESDGRAAADPE